MKTTYKFTQKFKPQPAVVTKDVVVVGDNGIGIVKAGTSINVPVEDGQIKVERKENE